MSSQRINLTSTPHSQRVTTAVAQLREALDALRHSKAVMEAAIDGTDYSQVEELFGVPAGLGDDLYNLVSAATTTLVGPELKALVSRVG